MRGCGGDSVANIFDLLSNLKVDALTNFKLAVSSAPHAAIFKEHSSYFSQMLYLKAVHDKL